MTGKEQNKKKQIMVCTMALVLAWLLTSCVAGCALLNHSAPQFTCLQNVDNNTPGPLTLPPRGVKWEKARGKELACSVCSLNDSPRQGICLVFTNMDTATDQLWQLKRNKFHRFMNAP